MKKINIRIKYNSKILLIQLDFDYRPLPKLAPNCLETVSIVISWLNSSSDKKGTLWTSWLESLIETPWNTSENYFQKYFNGYAEFMTCRDFKISRLLFLVETDKQ